MKKIKIIGWALILFSFITLTGFSPALADNLRLRTETPSPTPLPPPVITGAITPASNYPQEDQVKFSDLGMQEDKILQGPFDSLGLNFSLPADWSVQNGGQLELSLTGYFSSIVPAQNEVNFDNTVAGYLTVVLNGITLQKIVLQGNGDRAFFLAIPGEALQVDPLTGLYSLTIQWDASASCTLNLTTSVIIHPDSLLILPHSSVPLSPNLVAYPRPFIQPNSPQSIGVSVVVPPSPGTSDMQAALAVITNLGRTSQGDLSFSLIPGTQLSDEQLKANHLIFVGQTGAFEQLKTLPVFSSDSADDGVVQVMSSPWNPGRAVLVVTGGSGAAIQKAARALIAGPLIPTNPEKTVSVVKDIQTVSGTGDFTEDRTFGELGQSDFTSTTFGTQKMTFQFSIPPDMPVGAEAYMDLSFNHSQLIDYLRSGIVARINGSPVGSVRLGDATAEFNKFRMIIPATALRSGLNQMEIQVDMLPRDLCSDPRRESLWITVFADSLIHIPFTTQPISNPLPQTLGDYPRPFTSVELSNTVIVLPANDPASWQAAALLVFDLGMQTIGSNSSPDVFFADYVPENILTDKYIVVIGRPTQLPFLTQLAAGMPAAFDGSNDLLSEIKAQFSFKFQPGTSLGYLELASADQLKGKPVLAVLGSSDEGIQWAVRAMINSAQRRKLAAGNFAVVQGSRLTVLNIRSVEATAQAPEFPAGSISGTPVTDLTPISPQAAATSTWVFPVLIFSILLMVAILGYRIISNFQLRTRTSGVFRSRNR